MTVKHLCPVCGDEYINAGHHAEACTGTRATGVRTVPADQYHADAISDQPSLSASIAKLLISASPLHAWTQHPRLNPGYERTTDEKFDLGTVVHAVLLEGRDIVEPLAFPDWRKPVAQEMRKEVRAAGKIPLLVAQWQEVQEMVAAVRAQLPNLDVQPPILGQGKPEQTLVWEEDGVTCRALIDWLHDDYTAVDDIKTTKASADPASWTRTMYGFGGDVQVAFHSRGVKAVTGVDPEFRFLVCEAQPPFAVSVVALAPSALALANDRVDYALASWKRCLASGEWPGYDKRVASVEAPSYLEYAWMEKEAREEQAA